MKPTGRACTDRNVSVIFHVRFDTISPKAVHSVADEKCYHLVRYCFYYGPTDRACTDRNVSVIFQVRFDTISPKAVHSVADEKSYRGLHRSYSHTIGKSME